jgi:guanylate kinase
MKKIVLVGKGASGKNHLLKRLEERGFRHLVSHTTRPMRTGEKDGVEYHFVSKDEFERMVENDEFLEYQKFGENYYGTSRKEWEMSDVMILAPEGVRNINRLGVRKSCFIIYVDIDCDVRRQRLFERKGSTPEIVEKRILDDELEFKDYVDYDLRIQNSNF